MKRRNVLEKVAIHQCIVCGAIAKGIVLLEKLMKRCFVILVWSIYKKFPENNEVSYVNRLIEV